MKDLLVVGAGLTGAAICHSLRRRLGDRINITLWEASGNVGGRMNTIACTAIPNLVADVGAQYISTTRTELRRFAPYYDTLFAQKLLVPLTAPIHNFKVQPDANYFVAPHGFKSCIESLLQSANCDVHLNRRLIGLEQRGSSWVATAGDNPKKSDKDASKVFDAVVSTMPIPELLRVRGFLELARTDAQLHSALERVTYKPRFALALFYDSSAAQHIMRLLHDRGSEQLWAAKYIYDSDAVRYMAFDAQRRGLEKAAIEQLGCALVVHTTVPFGVKHSDAEDSDVQAIALDYVRHVLQVEQLSLPEPVEVRCIRFAYSQTHEFFAEQVTAAAAGTGAGVGYVELPQLPPLIIAGDCFAKKSAFDGCLLSATRATDRIFQLFEANVQNDAKLRAATPVSSNK